LEFSSRLLLWSFPPWRCIGSHCSVRRLDIHQHLCALCAGGDGGGLRGAPVVDVADSVDAADGAVGGAAFGGEELALDVGGGVVGEGTPG
jgi:hypothetical protein